MNRGDIKRILLPSLVKHSLIALICTSLIIIVVLLLNLAYELIQQINHISTSNDDHLSTQQVLYFIKTLFLYLLLGSLQFFGLYGVVIKSPNLLVVYGSSLAVSFALFLIDGIFQTSDSYFISLFLLIQGILLITHLWFDKYKRRIGTTNIHYIPMPTEFNCMAPGRASRFSECPFGDSTGFSSVANIFAGMNRSCP